MKMFSTGYKNPDIELEKFFLGLSEEDYIEKRQKFSKDFDNLLTAGYYGLLKGDEKISYERAKIAEDRFKFVSGLRRFLIESGWSPPKNKY